MLMTVSSADAIELEITREYDDIEREEQTHDASDGKYIDIKGTDKKVYLDTS